jgi:hypothetical protein
MNEFYLLGHNAVQSVESQVTFWTNMSPQSSGSENKPSKKTSMKADAKWALLSCWFPARLILWPSGRRRHAPLKHPLTFNRLHGIISHKTELFITNIPLRINYSVSYSQEWFSFDCCFTRGSSSWGYKMEHFKAITLLMKCTFAKHTAAITLTALTTN